MRTYALSAQELTRRLIASAASESGTNNGAAVAAHVASERACRELARSLGAGGFNALLTRSLAQAEADHPLLKDIRVGRGGDPILGGVVEIVRIHGDAAVAAGLEVMLATMLGLLGRLIGDDMVPRLVERRTTDGTHAEEDAQ